MELTTDIITQPPLAKKRTPNALNHTTSYLLPPIFSKQLQETHNSVF